MTWIFQPCSLDITEFVLVALPKLKTIVIGPNSFGVTHVFQLKNLKELRSVVIGSDSFGITHVFQLENLWKLESVVIGSDSFIANGLQGTMHIVNCNSLASIRFNDGSFAGYQSIELRGLPSLISIVMGEQCFSLARELVITGCGFCYIWMDRIAQITIDDCRW